MFVWICCYDVEWQKDVEDLIELAMFGNLDGTFGIWLSWSLNLQSLLLRRTLALTLCQQRKMLFLIWRVGFGFLASRIFKQVEKTVIK